MDEYITASLEGRVRVPAIYLYDVDVCRGKFVQFLVDDAEFREYYMRADRVTVRLNMENTTYIMRKWSRELLSLYFSAHNLTRISCSAECPLSYDSKSSWWKLSWYDDNKKLLMASSASSFTVAELVEKLKSVGFEFKKKVSGRKYKLTYASSVPA